MINRMDERIDGWNMGYKAARFDFDRGRKLGRGEGFQCGFIVGFTIAFAIVALLMFNKG